MKTNTMLTYLLYALLIGLVLAAGYQACRMQQQKKQAAEQEAELQKTLRNLGYADTTASSGSSFVEGSDSSGVNDLASSHTPSKPTVSASGIEDEGTSAGKQAPQTTTKSVPPTKSIAATKVPKTSTKGVSPSRDLNADSQGGRYQVRVGSFSVMDNARDQLEKVIKMGYQQAEIGKINHGKYATVVVMRSNSLSATTAVADKLEDKGVDALVYDTVRKKGAKN